MIAGGIELHGDVFAVKRERGKRDTLGGFGLGNLDGGRVFDDFGGIAEGLFRIPELQAAQLGGAFDGDEGCGIVFDAEDAADRLWFVGMLRATTDGAVHADDGNVQFENEAGIDGIGFVAGIEVKCSTAGRGPIDGFLEGGFVD